MATVGATQAAITSCANLSTVGTIVTGVWNGTTITAANGGTGVTSITALKNLLDDETWTFANNITGTLATVSQPNITTLAGLTSLGAAGATTNIVAGDVTMYNAVNDGNPTISLGSSATNRLEIKSVYNSGVQTLCDIDFTTYTASGDANDGKFNWYVDEVLLATINDTGLFINGDGNVQGKGDGATLSAYDSTTSSATEGGKLRLIANDGAVMADNHRLGVIEFYGAEDGSNTISVGVRIQAIARDAWDGSNNDADLEFYTTDGTTESKVLTLDADKLATFTGAATITGLTTLSGNLTFDSVALTGIQQSTEIFSKSDVSLMTSAAIDNAILANGSATTIKVLPHHFMSNEDGGANKSAQFRDDTIIGVRATHNDAELYAFVEIPIGKTATSVTVYGNDTSNVVEVFESDINAGALTDKTHASGCVVGTACDITNVAADATNYLVIKVTITSYTNDIVYGAAVTIA